MATEYSAEWVKVPDGNGGQRKVWLRDSKARKAMPQTLGTGSQTHNSVLSYGFVTGSAKNLYLCVPCLLQNEITAISVSSLRIGLRIPSGGYLVADNTDITQYVTTATVKKEAGQIQIIANNPSGWGVTNNIPVIGYAHVTFTAS